MLDIDHFKTVNDRFGHEVGDRVLVRVAELLREQVRADDVVARTGGEEFLLLMPRTDDAEALACCERVRRALHDEPWGAIAPGLRHHRELRRRHGARRRGPRRARPRRGRAHVRGQARRARPRRRRVGCAP